MIRNPIALLLSLSALALPAGAGEKIALRTLAVTPGDYPALWAMDASSPVKLEFPSVQPSAPARITGVNPLPLYQKEPGGDASAAGPPPAMLKIPEGGDILLLAWINQGKPNFLPIRDTSLSGKFNDWFVINTTGKSVGVQVGETTKPVVFPAGGSGPLRITAPAGEGAAVIMAANDNNTWSKFFSTYWPVAADKRCLVLIVETGGNIEVKQILEDLERKPIKEE